MSDNTEVTSTAPVDGSPPAPRSRFTLASGRLWIVVSLLAVLAAAAQLIGPATIPIGIASLTLMPMIWGLLMGGVVSGQRLRPLGVDLQLAANAILGVLVLVLVARFSFTIGPSIAVILKAGPALLLQEIGHLFGTILLALPLAVLLRMGPATVGATFSIDREPSFAMISNRYGSDSPQYQGVLSMYIFGSLFGAALVSMIASLASSLDIFNPLALAMGAGVGSSSMMAAGAGSVAAVHPELKDQILAVAATSNALTGLLGLYVGMFVALPLADRVYRMLTRGSSRPAQRETSSNVTKPSTQVTVPLHTTLPVVFGVGVLVSWLANGAFSWSIVGGYLLITALLAISLGISRITRGKISALLVIITLGAVVSSKISPIAGLISPLMGKVEITSIITAVLTAAGLGLGKDLPSLRRIGWRLVPVGIVAIVASYGLSTIIAEFALRLWS